MDIKIFEDLLQVTIERGNLCNRHDQIIHQRIVIDLVVFSRVEKWSCGARTIRET